MLLKMLTGLSGPTLCLARDDPYECEDPAEAIRLVDANFAEPDGEEAIAELAAARAAAAEEAPEEEASAEDETPAGDPPVEKPVETAPAKKGAAAAA